jgi:hypothetical protein
MTTFRLEDEQGRGLTNMQLNPPAWKPGDRIARGRDTLEVVEVRHGGKLVTLVVKGRGRDSDERGPRRAAG